MGWNHTQVNTPCRCLGRGLKTDLRLDDTAQISQTTDTPCLTFSACEGGRSSSIHLGELLPECSKLCHLNPSDRVQLIASARLTWRLEYNYPKSLIQGINYQLQRGLTHKQGSGPLPFLLIALLDFSTCSPFSFNQDLGCPSQPNSRARSHSWCFLSISALKFCLESKPGVP